MTCTDNLNTWRSGWCWIALLAAWLAGPGPVASAGAEPAVKPHVQNMRQAGVAVAERFMRHRNANTDYLLDINLEALLEFSLATGDNRYRQFALYTMRQRNWYPNVVFPWRNQYLNCLDFEMYRVTNNRDWLVVFLAQSDAFDREVERSPEGLVLYPRGSSRGGGYAILLDSLQEYASRMAKVGRVDDRPLYYRKCADQYRLARSILRDPKTGLWSEGRGWASGQPKALSPGAWSRGHGQLLRGMGQSLSWLPVRSPQYREVQGYVRELADTLLALQSANGLWPCLLNRSPNETPSETSGSALIAWQLALLWRDGVLPEDKYRAAAQHAFDALPNYVLTDGTVLNVCPTPGPLEAEEPWLQASYPPGDDNGTYAILFAAAGDAWLRRPRR